MLTEKDSRPLSATPGYHGRYLRIDVTSGEAEYLPIPPEILRQFLGGSGLGTWLMLREGAATADPLAPPAPLPFVFSPLVGSPLTTRPSLPSSAKAL